MSGLVLYTSDDGKSFRTKLYNLNLILAIGYRVRSPRGVQFSRWASTHLKEFLRKLFFAEVQNKLLYATTRYIAATEGK